MTKTLRGKTFPFTELPQKIIVFTENMPPPGVSVLVDSVTSWGITRPIWEAFSSNAAKELAVFLLSVHIGSRQVSVSTLHTPDPFWSILRLTSYVSVYKYKNIHLKKSKQEWQDWIRKRPYRFQREKNLIFKYLKRQ